MDFKSFFASIFGKNPPKKYGKKLSEKELPKAVKNELEKKKQYPLFDWPNLKRGYKFGVKTSYNNFHIGLDVCASAGTHIYAWDDLHLVKSLYGQQGGWTAWIEYDGMLFRLMHLQRKPTTDVYKKGDVIGIVGSTGMSTGPHVHLDISKNGKLELNNTKNFIDPEQYFKELIEN